MSLSCGDMVLLTVSGPAVFGLPGGSGGGSLDGAGTLCVPASVAVVWVDV